jgi:hypothetical protein
MLEYNMLLMRLIAYWFSLLRANKRWYVRHPLTCGRQTINFKDFLDCVEFNNGRFLWITTINASSNYMMTNKLQSIHEATGIEVPALINHILCMGHIIHLALAVSLCSVSIYGCTKSWEAHEPNQQVEENQSLDFGISQRLWQQGDAEINKGWAVKPCLAKYIGESMYFKIFWIFWNRLPYDREDLPALITSATTLVPVRHTKVFQSALIALTERHTLWWNNSSFPSPRWGIKLHTYLL